ncbi:MAG: hypothetical protein KatS3mg113_0255 [Planctomycetaceae bacterium]|nr:MAG: hypothetical protein KatS3mg113_0255 [Planctomycetaceae bacterium]
MANSIPSLMRNRDQHITRAHQHLMQRDTHLAQLMQRVGPFQLRLHHNRFELLVRSILSQQISTRAARAIRKKLQAIAGTPSLTPRVLLQLTPEQMRAAGLSAQKIRYLQALSDFALSGRLALQQMHRYPDEEVIAQLTAVPGIGVWTAQMFLIFSLGRLDVFPVDDLGLRASLREWYALPDDTRRPHYLALAAAWQPYRTIATWYVWRLSDLKRDPELKASRYPV